MDYAPLDNLPTVAQPIQYDVKMPSFQVNLDLPTAGRIRSYVEQQKLAEESKTNDAAMASAEDLVQREDAAAKDAAARMARAYARLGIAAPTLQQGTPTTGELASGVLAGLVGGNFEGANRSVLGLAQARAGREFDAATAQFNADQTLAKGDLAMAGSELDRANSARDRLSMFKISRTSELTDQQRQDKMLEEQYRREDQQLRDREKLQEQVRLERLHDDSLDRLRNTNNPAQVPLMVAEVNRLRRQLGVPEIPPEEVDGIVSQARQTAKTKGMSEVRMLLNGFGDYVAAYGGAVPDTILQSYNQQLKAIADEFGIVVPQLNNQLGPTLGGQKFELDQQQFKVQQRYTDAQIRKINNDIAISNRELALKIANYQNGGASVPTGDIDKQVRTLRQQQVGLGSQMRVLQQRIAGLPGADARDDDQEAQFQKLRSDLADLQQKNADIEGQLGYLNGLKIETQAAMPTSSIQVPRGAENYASIARNVAAEMGVDPDLVLRVIQAESGFNPQARSGVGAQGLMQLMPGTARQMGVKNAWDPEQNIRGGVKYLKMMLDRYGGDVALALAAYNAGPGAVDKAGGIPRIKETQNYVAKIMGSGGKQTANPKPAKPAGKAPAKGSTAPKPKAPSKPTSLKDAASSLLGK